MPGPAPEPHGATGLSAQRGPALLCHVELFASLPGTGLEMRAKGLSLELDYLDWSFNL